MTAKEKKKWIFFVHTQYAASFIFIADGKSQANQHYLQSPESLLYPSVLMCSLYLLQFPWKQIRGITFGVSDICIFVCIFTNTYM